MLVYDTETTGLTLHPDAAPEKQPRMIEFGGILLDTTTGDEVEELGMLVHPGELITAEITKITGITNDALVGAPRFRAVLPQLRDFFAKADTVVAHNLPFDRAIVRGELRRLDLDFGEAFPWPRRELCTVGVYKESWGRNPKMTELYEKVLGRPLMQTHRAVDDVRALVEIIRAERLWELL